jgi:outer membrane receptor protein involved in Fe transport
MRSINHYRLSGEDPVMAMGHTVFDLNLSRSLTRAVEFSFAIDNVTDRLYYETQNYFVSRLQEQQPVALVHGTPGYPLTVTAGLTFRFGSK